MIQKAFKDTDIDNRKKLMNSLVCVGGCSNIENMKEFVKENLI